jgi:N-methylhydantoinase A
MGVDVGGTFTDICMFNQNTGEVMVHKLPSTPQDPSEAIRNGISQIMETNQVTPIELVFLVHGTTVATNATLERKGCKTAIITTKGFRDVIELARQQRASLYDVQVDKPIPIVERRFRKEVDERVLFDGTVYKEINREEVEQLIRELKQQGIESYAVCFLHSYKNPVNEEVVEKIIQELHPEAYVSISSRVLPEYREYERITTTTLNSYIGPLVGNYANMFERHVESLGMNLVPYINQSNGGLMSIKTTFENPIRTALSGPAAGVSGANYIAKLMGLKDIITFDMGGTSTDVCLIENNSPQITTKKAIADFPVKVPMTDVVAVGAGGGSIAWVDSGGILKVGPESAGALPGPVSYGRGGTLPTVTDANVVLHRLNPSYILGGRMKIDEGGAYRAIEKLAKQLKMDVLDVARGIITVVNSNMSGAIRIVSVQRGYDPREYALIAFGGAGALHAAYVAKELGIKKVVIPCNPGILCAIGLLTSDIRTDYVCTNIMALDGENIDAMNKSFEELLQKGDAWLADEKIQKEQRLLIKHADMRYYGQNFELSIGVSSEDINADNLELIKQKFHDTHKREYGYCNENANIQIVNFRVTAIGKVSKIQFKAHSEEGKSPVKAIIGKRDVYFDEVEDFVATNVYNRDDLASGNIVEGPAIIEQMDSTIVIPLGHAALVDRYHNLIITCE